MSAPGRKGRRGGPKNFTVAESVSFALKIQLDKFINDEKATELKFPTFLSSQERGFIHATVCNFGLKSKSRGKGVNRYITVYKRSGSTIIQNDAKLILDSNMRCSITELLNTCPLTNKEKEDLQISSDKERTPQVPVRPLSQINTNIMPLVPSTAYNPELTKFRAELPVYQMKNELVDAIKTNQVIVVAGATGSGKTTQLPQIILDYCQENKLPARIYCTQPRRISAVAVAERVATERCEKVGHSIGYQIRLESRISPRTVLTYCTNGVLLRTLMGGENSLNGVSHIFVDEVHERDKFSDFLLIALRDNLARFKDLRVILMSATMDTQIFSRYFNNCPVISIPGRVYEVERVFLEDILKMTDYRSQPMAEAEQDMRKRMSSGEQCYWKHLQEQKSSAAEQVKEEQTKDDVAIDPGLQAEMDEFIEECYKEGSLDSFCQLLYMYMSEGAPVQCVSSLGRSGLMAAARHGLTETVKQILQIGGDTSVKDREGKTAHDHAAESGHAECARVIAAHALPGREEGVGVGAGGSEGDNYLVDVYNFSIPEDSVGN